MSVLHSPCVLGRTRIGLALLAVAALLASRPMTLWAQAAKGYDEIPIDGIFPDEKEVAKVERQIKPQVLLDTSDSRLNENKAAMDKYFGYFFGQMTHLDRLVELPNDRAKLYKDFATVKNGNVRNYMLTQSLNKANTLANGNYHPGVRYNAMLIIGDLDQVGADLIKQEPPVPYGAALGLLVRAYNDPQQIEAVRVAALLGIQRHAMLASQTWQPAQRDYIIRMMSTLLTQTAEAVNRDPAGHAWMQRRAIETLAAINAEGPKGEVLNLIAAKALDDKAPMSLRLTAAENLGRFPLKAVKLDATQVTSKLAGLAVTACQNELDRVAAMLKQAKADEEELSGANGGYGGYGGAPGMMNEGGAGMPGMPGMPGMMGMGMGMGMDGQPTGPKDDDYKMNTVRRRIKYQLNAVQLGLRGRPQKSSGIGGTSRETVLGGVIGKLGDKKNEASLTKVTDTIDEIMAIMDNEELLTLEALSTETTAKVKTLRGLVVAMGGAAAPPAEPDGLNIDPADPATLPGPGTVPGPGAAPGPGAPAAPGNPTAPAVTATP
ncbi:MAG: hypothetical protein KDA55_00860 [Planctomycetales bacterium]|nr:hypothetical protein [Planctomycetales bacterium]